jgi:hypothetical protein
VLDTTPPDLHIPDNVTLTADSEDGKTATPLDLGIEDPSETEHDGKGYWATDDCSPTITIVAFRDPSWPIGDGDDETDDDGLPEHLDGPYPLGTTRIVWIAFDENLNFVELYQYVTVNEEMAAAPAAPTSTRYAAAAPVASPLDRLVKGICEFPAALVRFVAEPSWKPWDLIG